MLDAFKMLVAMVLLVFSSFTMAANEATGFVYPIGRQYFPPTEQLGNGNWFHISQNFNTGSVWAGGGANGGWCESATGQDNRYQDKASCTTAGESWKYGHTGVDLAKDSGNCGDPIYATANGVVEFSGAYPGYGYLLKVRHVLPNGRVVRSIYGHRQSALMSAGQVVTKEEIVGYVGDTGSVVNGVVKHDAPCHLHFAIYDQDMPGSATAPPGYTYDDSGKSPDIAQANVVRYFYDPLLFVNDRNNESHVTLPGTGYWSVRFSSTQSVTTRTMYVVNGAGDAKSLQAAVDAGWIGSDVYWWGGSTWLHYASPYPIDSYTISAGSAYAFNALRSDLTLHWFIPGNTYRDARWRQDMAEFTTVNASLGFGRGLRDTYPDTNSSLDANYDLAYMMYEQPQAGTMYHSIVYIAHLKTDPLIRYVCYYNSKTSAFSNWVQVH